MSPARLPARLSLALSVAAMSLLSACPGPLVDPPADGGTPCRGCDAPGRDAPGTDAPTPPSEDGGPGEPDAPVIVPTCEGTDDVQPVSVEAMPESEDFLAPGRGVEQWHDQFHVDVPNEGDHGPAYDVYQRFTWSQLEDGAGDYDWGRFDEIMNGAIATRQTLSFGIMTSCPGCPEDYSGLVRIDGSLSAYPADLHDAMQDESVSDWVSDGYWVPNWNSEAYLSRFETFLRALAAHIDATSHDGVAYRDALGYVDVRGYGSWGEWHVAGIADTVDDQPSGRASAASLIRLIDAHVDAFPRNPLVLLICTFDGNRYGNMGVPPEVGAHALTVENEWGPLGWRRDNWGTNDDYVRALLDRSSIEHDGVNFRDEIMSRWQVAPVVGEPPYFRPGGGACDYDLLEEQVLLYHAASFGNGNYGGAEDIACVRDNVREAARAAGYRYVIEGGEAHATIHAGGPFEVSLTWRNEGVAPSYQHWDVRYELVNEDGDVAWSGGSSLELRELLPGDGHDVTDALVLDPSVPAGTYDLVVTVRDPAGYRAPLPLALEGRTEAGSYRLRSVTVLDCP